MVYKIKSLTPARRKRFESRYIKQLNGCWEWTSYKEKSGYGLFWIEPNNKYAHRLSWMIANTQDWPTDKPHARHTCNNKSCVNPAHIVPGTATENMHDRYSQPGGYSPNAKTVRVKTPQGVFSSIKAAAAAHQIPYQTMQSRIGRSLMTGYEYI